MNAIDAPPTRIEKLPVEIFLEIFALFSLGEIITSFFGLNSRINSIIRCAKSISHTISNSDTTSVDQLKLFPTLISRLFITGGVTIDFTSLINLRSLTIEYGTLAQLNGIRPQHSPMLEILHISAVNSNSEADERKTLHDLFEVILSNGFPRLRIFTAIGIEPVDRNETWTGSPALRTLILNLKTSFDCEHVRSLCPNLRQFKSASYLQTNPPRNVLYSVKRRMLLEIGKIQKWEFEKKFILDFCPMIDIYNSSASSDNTESTKYLYNVHERAILGRILPEKEPYCFASFRIEIRLPTEYPFQRPKIIILDRIYHPNISSRGEHCCCWGLVEKSYQPWRLTMPLTDCIKAVIDVVDNITSNHLTSVEFGDECENNYEKFYETALEYTLKYGRPRC